MSSDQFIGILNMAHEGDLEAVYQAFYLKCQDVHLADDTAAKISDYIYSLFETSADPAVKSYCLLFLGAVLDATKTSDSFVSAFLKAKVDGLNNFEALDERGRFIHFLNHAVYLADSIRECGGAESDELRVSILNAYLRSDIQFGFNEDIVLAEYLLNSKCPEKMFIGILDILAPSAPTEKENPLVFAAREANKRALWMSIHALNSEMNIYDTPIFLKLVQSTIKRHFG